MDRNIWNETLVQPQSETHTNCLITVNLWQPLLSKSCMRLGTFHHQPSPTLPGRVICFKQRSLPLTCSQHHWALFSRNGRPSVHASARSVRDSRPNHDAARAQRPQENQMEKKMSVRVAVSHCPHHAVHHDHHCRPYDRVLCRTAHG